MSRPSSTRCPTCDKPQGICVCDRVQPMAVGTRVLVLQHPEEGDEVLGTTRLLELSLPGQVVVRRGTAWAGLDAALGGPADPKRWAVLWHATLPRPLSPEEQSAPVVAMDARGGPIRSRWQGLVVLDGTWAQGKTLWQRNPWLARLGRVVLHPTQPSIYGKTRREPRREAVSTLEAVADALVANGEDPAVRETLRRLMRTMVQRARDTDPRKPRQG